MGRIKADDKSKEIKAVDNTQKITFGRLYTLALLRIANNNSQAVFSTYKQFKIASYFEANYPHLYEGSASYQHRNGFLEGDKPLTTEHMLDFLMELIGKPGLDNYSRIEKLLEASDMPGIKQLKDNEVIIAKMAEHGFVPSNTHTPLEVPYIVDPLKERNIIYRSNLDALADRICTNQRLFLAGESRTGKTVIMKLIARKIPLTYFDQVFWLDGSQKNRLVASIIIAQSNRVSMDGFRLDYDYRKSLKDLFENSSHLRTLLLISNCGSREIVNSVSELAPLSCHYIIEVNDAELASDADPMGLDLVFVQPFNEDEIEAYWNCFAKNSPNVTRPVYNDLCNFTKKIPVRLARAVAAFSYNPKVFKKFDISSDVSDLDIFDAEDDCMAPDMRLKVYRLGALPPLRSYQFNVFTNLWECDDLEARDMLQIMELLLWADPLPDDEGWSISKDVLDYAKTKLEAGDPIEKGFAENWIRRINPELIYKNFMSNIQRHSQGEFIQQKRSGPKFKFGSFKRVALQLINPLAHNTYWNLFCDLSSWMHSAEWLAAYHQYSKDVTLFRLIRSLVPFGVLIMLAMILELVFDFSLINALVAILLPITAYFLTNFLVSYIPSLNKHEMGLLKIWQQVQKRIQESG